MTPWSVVIGYKPSPARCPVLSGIGVKEEERGRLSFAKADLAGSGDATMQTCMQAPCGMAFDDMSPFCRLGLDRRQIPNWHVDDLPSSK